MELPKWKIIRDENGKLLGYKLTDDIYITREKADFKKCEYYYKKLYYKGELIKSTSVHVSYNLPDLKKLGLKLYIENYGGDDNENKNC